MKNKPNVSHVDNDIPKKEPNYKLIKLIFFGSIIAYALWHTYFKDEDKPVEQQSYLYTPKDSNHSTTTLLDSSMVYRVAQELIINNHAMETAPIFRETPVVYVYNPIDSTYKILSFLKSRDSNFDMRKENFTVRLHFKGGDADVLENWDVLSMSFSNERL